MRAVGAWARRRPTAAAAALYAVLSLGLVSPGLLPGKTLTSSDSFWFHPPWESLRPAELDRPANPELGDGPAVFEPFLQFTSRELPDVPLWNPYITGGRPFLANAQSAVFSPFSLPAYVLPFATAIGLIAALKLFAAAFGTFLLARALGIRPAGAGLAGVVYGFNLWLVAWLSYPHASAWALIPWLLLATELVVRRPDLLSAAALAAAAALVFVAGHPESSFHALLAATAFLALRLWRKGRGGCDSPRGLAEDGGGFRRRRALAVFVAGLFGGAALAGVALLPFLELLLRSADVSQRAGTAGEAHLDRRYLLGMLLPGYWGRATETPLEFFLAARALYAGALPLMLAAVAVIARPSRERTALALFGATCMAVVAGIPPVFQLVTNVPPFSSGHNTRLVALYMLCVALLAGLGLDELGGARRLSSRRSAALMGLAGALVLAPLAWVVVAGTTSLAFLGEAVEAALKLADPPPLGSPSAGGVVRLEAVLVWLGFAGAGALLVAARARGRLGTATFAALALALAAADLFRAGMGYNPAIEREAAVQPATGAIRYLESRRPGRFVSTGSVRVPGFGGPDPRGPLLSIPQNVIPMRHGLYEARGYDLPLERRYDTFWRRELSPEYPSQAGLDIDAIPLRLPRVTEPRLRALSLLGVTDVMQPRRAPPLRVEGLRLAYEGPDARVYANRGALPRAWIAPEQRVVDGSEAALEAITEPRFDARAVAVTERPVPGVPRQASSAPAPAAAAASRGRAAIHRYEPEQVSVRATATRPGLLVLSDLHYPGWKARVDGRAVDVERVDYLFRGVRLPAGEHLVEFSYEPLSWLAGRILTILALVGLAAAVVVGARGRRGGVRPTEEPPPRPQAELP